MITNKKISSLFTVISSFIIIISIQVSCAGISPVNMEREKYLSYSIIDDIIPQWQEFADGIGYLHGKINQPLMEFWVLMIDLSSPNINIVVKSGGRDSLPMQDVKSTKVTSFVRDNNLIAGVNSTPFNIVSGIERRPIKNIGIVISNGQLLSPAVPRYDAFVFYKDGSSQIISQALLTQSKVIISDDSGNNANNDAVIEKDINTFDVNMYESIENAIGGFNQILKNGEPVKRIIDQQIRHPRTAAGISSDSKYLYLLVIDGRRTGSTGATEKETAMLLKKFGCEDGINFDGGGSTAMALRFPNGKIKTVNYPIHSGIMGNQRAVAGCIGIEKISGTNP